MIGDILTSKEWAERQRIDGNSCMGDVGNPCEYDPTREPCIECYQQYVEKCCGGGK